MIKKVVTRIELKDSSVSRSDLDYWLKRPPEERISAVEILRRQRHGSTARLHKCARVIPLSQS
jgi:hypothetical protein